MSNHLKGSLDLLLMAVLRDGPAHGYAIIAALRERSDGRFDLAEGTIYPALHKLEAAGLVAGTWDTSGARRRRVYALTAQGRRAQQAEQREWARFALGVQAVVGWSA